MSVTFGRTAKGKTHLLIDGSPTCGTKGKVTPTDEREVVGDWRDRCGNCGWGKATRGCAEYTEPPLACSVCGAVLQYRHAHWRLTGEG